MAIKHRNPQIELLRLKCDVQRTAHQRHLYRQTAGREKKMATNDECKRTDTAANRMNAYQRPSIQVCSAGREYFKR
jgi:hypothetical protein